MSLFNTHYAKNNNKNNQASIIHPERFLKTARALTAAALISTGFTASLSLAIPLKAVPTEPNHVQLSFKSVDPIALANREYAEQFSQVNALLKKGEHEKVLELADTVLAKDPSAELALEVKALALMLRQEFDVAQSLLLKAIEENKKQASLWIHLGITQMEQGSIAQAEESFFKALTLAPNNRLAHQRLGLLYEFDKKPSLAVQHLRKGLEGVPAEQLSVSLNLAKLLNDQGRFDEAIAVLAPRLSANLGVYEAHMVLGRAYLSTEQFQKAFKRFESAYIIRPGDLHSGIGQARALRGLNQFTQASKVLNDLAKAHANAQVIDLERGETYLNLENYKAAQKAFDSAIKQGYPVAKIEQRMVRHLISQGDYKTAQKRLETAIEKHPDMPGLYAQLAEVYQVSGNHKAGIHTLEQGLKVFPENAALRFKLGTYLAAIGDYTHAVEILKTVLQHSPASPMALRALTVAQRKAGDIASAVQSAEQLSELSPDNPPDLLLLATALEANQQLEKAQAVYAQTLAKEPNNVLALNNLASLMADHGDIEVAEQYARQAATLKSDNAQVLDTLGWILYKRARYEAALEQFKTAIHLAPQHANIWYHQGRTLMAMGKTQEAKTALEKAVSMQSTASWAKEARALIHTMN